MYFGCLMRFQSGYIAALSHDVVTEQQNLRKIVKDMSTRLRSCESENAVLKQQSNNIIRYCTI